MIPFPNIDPVAVQLGPIAIRWYGLSYVLGFFLVLWGIKRRAKRGLAPVTPRQADDLIFYGAVGLIVGARVGYCLFYQPAALLADPLMLVRVWDGGMSFHGGLIGTALGIYWYSRKVGQHFFDLVDVIALFAPIGLACGRLANFINGELYGRVTDVPWAMEFPRAPGEARHPSQLYELFLEGIVLLLILQWLARKPMPRGVAIGVFVAGYGVFRFIVEFFREPDAHIADLVFGWMSRGQLLCLPMIAVGAGIVIWAYRRRIYPDFSQVAAAAEREAKGQ